MPVNKSVVIPLAFDFAVVIGGLFYGGQIVEKVHAGEQDRTELRQVISADKTEVIHRLERIEDKLDYALDNSEKKLHNPYVPPQR